MLEPLRIYRASKRGQRKKLIVSFVMLIPFFIFGVWLLLVRSQPVFETCLALAVISVSLLWVFSFIRIVCHGQPHELRVYADRLQVIDPWAFPQAMFEYDFVDIKSVIYDTYDSDGFLELTLVSSPWIRNVDCDAFRDAAETQEFCRYLTNLLKTPTHAINTPVA